LGAPNTKKPQIKGAFQVLFLSKGVLPVRLEGVAVAHHARVYGGATTIAKGVVHHGAT
jgi:hypothetical protein